ncbi:MAG: 2-methylcitrate dehydratase PrpD [Gammaproteobacteria bacterium]|jgi:2-methylcitrate dehydratase PrpD
MPNQAVISQDLSRDLCATLSAWRYEDLPAAVVEQIKLFMLDTLGVIGGAAGAPGIAELHARLARWESAGRCASLLGGWHGSPPNAAFGNAAAAHALDYDDQHDPARTHSYCVVLPSVLAAAQEIGAVDGKRFITAVAVGVELHTRLGLACHRSLEHGWHPTTALGTLGSAVAAGHVLGLSAQQLLNALGLAFHQLGGTRQAMIDGVLAKRLGAGFAARSGVTAAFLAADGLTGPSHPLEGEAGLFAVHERGDVNLAALTEGIGQRWETSNISMKPYPCCRCNHSTIDLAFELRARGLRAEDVASATVAMGRVNRDCVGARYEPHTAGDPIVHAQFSAAYAFARALTDGEISLESYRPESLVDPQVVALAQRIEVVTDPQVDDSALAPARVEVRRFDGSIEQHARTQVRGSPAEPMSEADVMRKFYTCLASGLNASQNDAEELAEAVLNLQTLPDATVIAAKFPTQRLTAQASMVRALTPETHRTADVQ